MPDIPGVYERLLFLLPLDPAIQGPAVYDPSSSYPAGWVVSSGGWVYVTAGGASIGHIPGGTAWTLVGRSPIGDVWDTRIDKQAIGGILYGANLQYLYTRLDLIDFQLGWTAQTNVNWEQTGISQDDQGAQKNLQNLRDSVWDLIVDLETKIRASRGPVWGTIHTSPTGAMLTRLGRVPMVSPSVRLGLVTEDLRYWAGRWGLI